MYICFFVFFFRNLSAAFVNGTLKGYFFQVGLFNINSTENSQFEIVLFFSLLVFAFPALILNYNLYHSLG